MRSAASLDNRVDEQALLKLRLSDQRVHHGKPSLKRVRDYAQVKAEGTITWLE